MKAALALFAALLVSCALAQAEDIYFDVEIVRVNPDGTFTPVEYGLPGDVIEYRVTATNVGDIIYRPGTVVVTLPIGDGVAYIEGTATPSSEGLTTEFSADGGDSFDEPPVVVDGDVAATADYDSIQWTFEVPFEPGRSEVLTYRVRLGGAPSPAGRPGTNSFVDDFSFGRVGILDAGAGYVQVVGEVASQRSYESVAFRVTLYGRSGQILGTDTFIVEAVGPRPRVFDTLVSRVDASSVADYALQVEWTR